MTNRMVALAGTKPGLGIALLLAAGVAPAQEQLLRDGFEALDCAVVQELTGLFPQPAPAQWQELFSGATWPNPDGNFRSLRVFNGYMVNMPIAANSASQAGRLELSEAPGQPGGPVVVSISRCRGDFRLADLNNSRQRCLGYGTSAPTVLWVIDGPPSPDYCPLQAGQGYWINVAYLDIPYGTAPVPTTCADPNNCFTLIGSRSLNAAELQVLLERQRRDAKAPSAAR